MAVKRDPEVARELARRFQGRIVELAKEGVFGSLRTRNASLQSAYAHLLSLLDSPEVPVLIYGERGAGKRRHVDELFQMHNVCRKLEDLEPGKLRVVRGDFTSPGFTQLLAAPQTQAADLIYLEGVDLLSAAGQEELLEFLKRRKIFADKGLPLPRLILGTEQALSVQMICGEFRRDLFQAISGFAVFLPTLRERSEDLPHLVQVFAEKISGRTQTPPTWFVDFVSKQEWYGNLDDLSKLIQQLLLRQPDLARCVATDLPPEFQPRMSKTFQAEVDRENARLRGALAAKGGDRRQSAQMLGIPYGEFLEKLISHNIR
ncbi:MAG: hypothetical protein JST16_10155 [Bdellovibrionales bacterium]|nr:hypothetical protein [Bdellovibrionales bacterium]